MDIRGSHRIERISTYYFADKLAQIRQMGEAGMDVINLGVGNPDLGPHHSIRLTVGEMSRLEGVHGYQPYRGIPELRQAMSDWYRRFYFAQVDPSHEILPLIGSKEGVFHISMAFLNEGDEVLVPNPGYLAYQNASQLAGARLKSYTLKASNAYLPDMKELEAMDTSRVKIMWISYPHMPTGATASLEVFKKLIRFTRDNNIILCHDNPYALILNKVPVSLFQLDDARENCLELFSMSKMYNMAGWRVGAMIASKQIVDLVLKFKSNVDSGMFKPIQMAATEALTLGIPWFDMLNDQYRKRQVVGENILSTLGCTFKSESAGLFIWARVPDHYDSGDAFSDALLEKCQLFLTPGSIFGDQGRRYVRLSLCAPEQRLKKALDRVSKFVNVNPSKV